MKIQIDTYHDITCQECGMSWSTDFNANTQRMDGSGMGMNPSKSGLSRLAYRSGWKCRDGKTLCPECLKRSEGKE